MGQACHPESWVYSSVVRFPTPQNKRGERRLKLYFGSRFQRFWSRTRWSPCFWVPGLGSWIAEQNCSFFLARRLGQTEESGSQCQDGQKSLAPSILSRVCANDQKMYHYALPLKGSKLEIKPPKKPAFGGHLRPRLSQLASTVSYAGVPGGVA